LKAALLQNFDPLAKRDAQAAFKNKKLDRNIGIYDEEVPPHLSLCETGRTM